MFRAIVVGTDGSDTAAEAVRRASDLAGLCGADLHVVTAYRPPSQTPMASAMPEAMAATALVTDDEVKADIRRLLENVVGPLEGSGVRVHTHAVAQRPADAILSVAEDVGADLVVVGNRGLRGARRILGSVPNSVAHNAPCAVLIVHTT